jgi:hypothetical protein
MSHSHAKLDVDHKCVAAKCPGVLVDPPESYGKWAYWWGNEKGRRGWHNKPNPRPVRRRPPKKEASK